MSGSKLTKTFCSFENQNTSFFDTQHFIVNEDNKIVPDKNSLESDLHDVQEQIQKRQLDNFMNAKEKQSWRQQQQGEFTQMHQKNERQICRKWYCNSTTREN